MTLAQFVGCDFESSSGLTPEFASFAEAFKSHLKSELGKDFDIVKFNCGHFYVSSFFRNRSNGKMAYMSVSDVRFSKDEWNSRVLVRTAKDDVDYSGGSNCFCRLSGLPETLHKLTA